MTAFSTVVGITRASLRVLRAQPRLALFPLLGFATTGGLLVLFLPGLGDPVSWLVLAFLYFAVHGVAVFFSAALVSEALRALRGESISVAGGLDCATSRIGALAGYAAIESTVGLVLGALARPGRSARWVARGIFGTAWSLVSYLVLPVLIAERRGAYASLRRSGELFRHTWGETTLSEIGFRIATVHLLVAVIVVCLLIARLVADPVAVALAILFIVGFAVLACTLQAIYRAALYIFAAEGVVADEFDTLDMHEVWRVK